MPIRVSLRWFYPIDWPQLSRQIRFGRARGRCETGLSHRPYWQRYLATSFSLHGGRCNKSDGPHGKLATTLRGPVPAPPQRDKAL
jgi:hypothetical protein